MPRTMVYKRARENQSQERQRNQRNKFNNSRDLDVVRIECDLKVLNASLRDFDFVGVLDMITDGDLCEELAAVREAAHAAAAESSPAAAEIHLPMHLVALQRNGALQGNAGTAVMALAAAAIRDGASLAAVRAACGGVSEQYLRNQVTRHRRTWSEFMVGGGWRAPT